MTSAGEFQTDEEYEREHGAGIRIRTNRVPRLTIDAFELTESERAEFDYLDWPAIDAGEESATFVRYKGDLWDLAEFMAPTGEQFGPYWHGCVSTSFFTATLVHMCEDGESVVMGEAWS